MAWTAKTSSCWRYFSENSAISLCCLSASSFSSCSCCFFISLSRSAHSCSTTLISGVGAAARRDRLPLCCGASPFSIAHSSFVAASDAFSRSADPSMATFWSSTFSIVSAVPHKDFSDLHEKMSGKGQSASEAHRSARAPKRARACCSPPPRSCAGPMQNQ